jgi:Sulfite exporter TauE/SafE.
LTTYLILALWLSLASFLQSGIGFGLPIIAMILLVRLFPYNGAIAMCQSIALLNTVYLTVKNRKSIDYGLLMPLLVPTAVIGIFTTVFAFSVDAVFLEFFLGLFFVVLALHSLFFQMEVRFSDKKAVPWAIGVLNGVLNGFFGIGGPPAVMYLVPRAKSRESYIGTVSLYFTVCNVINLGIRIAMGAYDMSVLSYTAAGWIGAALGLVAAAFAFRKLKGELLKIIVYVFVLLNGLWMMIKPFV